MKNLKELREKAGLTQKEVSDKLGYTSCQFVSNWERGLAWPPVETYPEIARLYRVPMKVMVKLHLDRTEAKVRAEFKKARCYR